MFENLNGVQDRVEGVRLSSDGSGVGFIEGLATFVPGLLPGEIAEIKILDRRKRFQRAELMELLQPALERRDALCPVFAICGGCQLQHLDYSSALAWKRQWVADALQRLGRVEVEQGVNPTQGMDFPWRYRNKARLHHDQDGRLGYYADKTHETVRFPDCLLLSEEMNAWIKILEEALGKDHPSIQNLTLRQNLHGEGLCLLENVPAGPEGERLLEQIQSAVPKSLVVQGLQAGRVVGLAQTAAARLEVEIMGLKFRVSPLAFLQVNPVMTEKLYALVLSWAELSEKEIVWDLYSGIGTLTLVLAGHAQEVWGIEEHPQAVEDAQENALLNGLEHAHFRAGRVEERIQELSGNPDAVVLDPPRAGVQPAVIDVLLRKQPKRIIYVSCDPGTLARDTGKLVEGGYVVEQVLPVDMFPWTVHVESIIMMTYSGQKGK